MILNNNIRDIFKNRKSPRFPLLFINISGIKKYFSSTSLSVKDVTAKSIVGTVTATQGSKTLTGSSTTFLTVPLDSQFRITSSPNQPYYDINKINSNTELMLTEPYRGGTISSSTYELLTDFLEINYLPGMTFSNSKTKLKLDNMSSEISRVNVRIDGTYKLQDLRESVAITNGTAELGIWTPGLKYEDRIQLAEGSIRNISWGHESIPFSFTIIDNRRKNNKKFPPTKVTTTNFVNAPDASVGSSYPVLYGTVVHAPAVLVGQIPGGSGDNRWIVAGHDIDELTTAYHNGVSFDPTDSGTDTDGDGVTYFYLESDLAITDESITVDTNGTKDGSSFFSNVAESVEDIATKYSNLDSSEIDSQRFGTAKAKLGDKWKMSSVFNGASTNESTVFDTVQRRLTDQFPIIPFWREGKYGIIVIDFDNVDPVFKLFKDKNIIKLEGNVTESDVDKVFNSFELYYAFDALNNIFTKYKFLNSGNSTRSKISQNKYELQEAPAINAIDIQDDITADNLLKFREKLLSEVVLMVNYRCTYDTAVIEEGDWVSITDPEQSWDNKTFLCIGKTYGIQDIVISFRELV